LVFKGQGRGQALKKAFWKHGEGVRGGEKIIFKLSKGGPRNFSQGGAFYLWIKGLFPFCGNPKGYYFPKLISWGPRAFKRRVLAKGPSIGGLLN